MRTWKLVRQQYRAWSDCADVQAGLTLVLVAKTNSTFGSRRIRIKHYNITNTDTDLFSYFFSLSPISFCKTDSFMLPAVQKFPLTYVFYNKSLKTSCVKRKTILLLKTWPKVYSPWSFFYVIIWIKNKA